MAPHTYGEILARNLRAARSRIDIGQDSLAARMRALGYDKWLRQTVGSTERGKRRPAAEELLGLAYSLETSIAALLSPTQDDKKVEFPSGSSIEAESVTRSVRRGINDRSVDWDGDVPARIGEPTPTPGVHPAFDAWGTGDH